MLCFLCGFHTKEKYLMGTSDKYILTEPLVMGNAILPKGSILYDSYDGKMNKYYVFVNLSHQSYATLEKYEDDSFNPIVPIDVDVIHDINDTD